MSHTARSAAVFDDGRQPLDRVVVAGASIGGLLAAAAVARQTREVVLLDRDGLPTTPDGRRGVPQGRHVHALTARGLATAEDLLPGLTRELIEAGAIPTRAFAEIRFDTAFGTLPRQRISEPMVNASRPLLEHLLRRRVAALPHVRIHDRTEVLAPVWAAGRVRGVRALGHDTDAETTVAADLVVDASGRGGRVLRWLEQAGFPTPPVEEIHANLRYVTADIALDAPIGTDRFVLTVARPDRPTGVAAQWLEGQRWRVTIFGYGPHQPSAAEEEFLPQLAAVAPAEVYRALCGAALLAEPVTNTFPSSIRRRFERLRRVPPGLVVLGDAVCSFNPVYGQGMTVAALQAQVLQQWLASGGGRQPRAYYRAAARCVEPAWQIAAGADLALPVVQGPRPRRVRLLNAYVRRVQAAAVSDPVVARAFQRVTGLLSGPQSLLAPGIALRVLRAGRPRPLPLTDTTGDPHPRLPAALGTTR